MPLLNPPRLVAFVVNPRTARDILRLASPRFEVMVEYSAPAALAAIQAAGASAVIVAEQTPRCDDGHEAPQSTGPGAAALLEAARIRCPAVHRVLLAAPDQLPELIPILHGGTVSVIAALPIDPKEFLAAITANLPTPRPATAAGNPPSIAANTLPS
ncbi:hypothetical protein [Humisphaera borealis]|uniref:Uncharacterized protein n=1 Tax=Humisphaera borealis TaxID=2807512 RepID=A0A7M2WWV4_9BACT|nr:hypothetical protein [Humisphaera borealis]QOV89956.1 hypothetical protein IPV69_00865 [Humisphaera borealis]